MKRLNIPVTHFLKLWMGNTRMVGSLSQDPGLVSDEIIRVDKGNIRINIITNLVLPGRWRISVGYTRSSSDSI